MTLPDFTKMSKLEIIKWGDEHGYYLSSATRGTRASMIRVLLYMIEKRAGK